MLLISKDRRAIRKSNLNGLIKEDHVSDINPWSFRVNIQFVVILSVSSLSDSDRSVLNKVAKLAGRTWASIQPDNQRSVFNDLVLEHPVEQVVVSVSHRVDSPRVHARELLSNSPIRKRHNSIRSGDTLCWRASLTQFWFTNLFSVFPVSILL